MVNKSPLNVALFSTDIKLSQKVSLELRGFGVFAAFYNNVSELVKHLNLNECHLVIVDDRNLDLCHKFLNVHPKVESDETLVAMISEAEVQSSLFEHSSFKPIGVLSLTGGFSSQITSLLYWVKKFSILKRETIGLGRELNLVSERFGAYIDKTDKSNKAYQQLSNVSSIVKSLYQQSLRDKDSFLIALSKLFEKWEGVQSYGFYQLNHSFQKLVGLDVVSRKHRKFPNLKLGKTCSRGIEKFAQEMAYQVAFEELGVNSIILRIEGSVQLPEILCFVSFNDKSFSRVDDHYHWNLFEVLLSNVYRRTILQAFDDESPAQFLPIWDALNFLDESRGDDNEYKFININLVRLNEFIGRKSNLRFYWKSFFNDLLIELSKKMESGVKISTFGTTNVVLMIPYRSLEKHFLHVKNFLETFEYWKYFSDTKIVLPRYTYPEAYLVPGSSSHFILNHSSTKNLTSGGKAVDRSNASSVLF